MLYFYYLVKCQNEVLIVSIVTKSVVNKIFNIFKMGSKKQWIITYF
jgi:hypothetical protein